MYVGQDVERTMKFCDIGESKEATQLRHKINLTRSARNIDGNCWWPGYLVSQNKSGIADSLKADLQSTIALVPEYPWISSKRPAKVSGFKYSGNKLKWQAPKPKDSADDAVKFVVYRFEPGEEIDLGNAYAIDGITWSYEYPVSVPGVYIVTALSRVNQESSPSHKITVSKADIRKK